MLIDDCPPRASIISLPSPPLLLSGRPSHFLAVWRCFGVQFMTAGLWKMCHDCLQFMSPVLLQQIVLFLQDHSAPLLDGVLLAFLLLLCNACQSICVHAYFHIVYRVSFHMRAALISLVYQKALKISGTSRQRTSAGQIVRPAPPPQPPNPQRD